MFARVTSMNIKKDRIDKAIEIYYDSVIPAAKNQTGFLGAYLLIDRETGKGISITSWKSEGDARANEDNQYYQQQLVKFHPFFSTPPIREGFEVACFKHEGSQLLEPLSSR
ncbi:antibiotic biosynthesis monooxygenase family protein [Acidobacteriota bacterium]